MFVRYYASVLFFSITLNLMLASDANAIYSPQTGRFLTRDPITYHDGLSLYRNYLEMRHLDPGGELLWIAPAALPIVKAVVVVGGIVVAAVTIEVLVIDTIADACKKNPTSPECKKCPPKPPCPCDRNASMAKSSAHSVLNLAESGWTDRDGNPILRPFSNHWEAAMFEKEHGKAAHDAMIRMFNPGFQGESHLGEFEGPCDGLKEKVKTLQRQLVDCGQNGFSIPPNCGDALGFGSRMLDNRCKPLGFGGGVLGGGGVR